MSDKEIPIFEANNNEERLVINDVDIAPIPNTDHKVHYRESETKKRFTKRGSKRSSKLKTSRITTKSAHNSEKKGFFATYYEKFKDFLKERGKVYIDLVSWAVLLSPMAFVIGIWCACLIWGIDYVTHIRFNHPWLLYMLPLCGIVEILMYKTYIGSKVSGGFDFLLDQIHFGNKIKKRASVPFRMGPLIFCATLLTHLFGGSSGREGSGLQIGASCSNLFIRISKFITKARFPLRKSEYEVIIIAGIGAGFAATFGTPLSAAFFAIEVVNIGRVSTDRFVPCFITSIFADYICKKAYFDWMGGEDESFKLAEHSDKNDYSVLGYALLVSIFSAWTALIFIFLHKKLKKLFEYFGSLIVRVFTNKEHIIITSCIAAFIGACIIIALRFIVGNTYYLGISTIRPEDDPNFLILSDFFENKNYTSEAFILKLIFTCVTLGAGFKGGEVINLFFIGAALGSATGHLVGFMPSYLAALGMISVFAGASNTPITCTLLAFEKFGIGFAVIYAFCSFITYVLVGWGSIYHKQRVKSVKLLSIFCNDKKQLIRQSHLSKHSMEHFVHIEKMDGGEHH